MTQEVLLYDVVHDYIISENFASDTEGANKVMLKLSDELMQEIYERTMTASEKRKDTMLKKKYDDSDMKKNMQDQYGKEEGKKVYFATIRKQAMKKEEVELSEMGGMKVKQVVKAKPPKNEKDMSKEPGQKAPVDYRTLAQSYKPVGNIFNEKKMDPVGQEDGDINNDGKKDGTDKYLKNRRAAIGKAIAKKRGRVKEGFSAWRIELDFNEQVKK